MGANEASAAVTERKPRMISYAQNFEDVILARALDGVEQGFYVDVGAAHPIDDSVTHHFSQLGWSGVNIEPDPRLFKVLAAARTRDINLPIVIGNPLTLGESITLHVVANPGLSTISATTAREHESAGFDVTPILVDVRPLADVLAEHVGSRDIHFIKIDVEGAELGVIETGDWSTYRPWIAVIETTVSNMTSAGNVVHLDPRTNEVDDYMVSRGYTPVYFDGLNHFYIADERSHLAEQIAIPPNVFDDFVRLSEFRCTNARDAYQQQAENAEHRLIDAEHRLIELNTKISRVTRDAAEGEREMRAWAATLESEITRMLQSRRWRITHPGIRDKR